MKRVIPILLVLHSIAFAQTPCDEFSSGYRQISWDFTPAETVSHLTDKGYRLFEKYEYEINDGRTADRYHFKYNDYDHYKSDRDFFEYIIKFINNEMISIQYLNHFNWNYNYRMAKNSAMKIAEKYDLPQKNEQKLSFGMTNEVWFHDCPKYRVLLQLLWNPNVVYDNYPSGEVTRYIEMWIFNVEKEEEYHRIVQINRNEKRQSNEDDILNRF